MIVLMEGLTMCFILLLVCVIGIANGPAGLVVFYENDVQERVVELGIITKKRIKRNRIISTIALFVPMLFFPPFMAYCINGARGFMELFWQIAVILVMMGMFDRIFIDWFWVGHTKAWFIPGTEDLMPYITRKRMLSKIITTVVGYLAYAAIVAVIFG